MQPLKNKIAKEVVKGLKEILQKGRKCKKKLRTDKGSEFSNRLIQDFLKFENMHYLTAYNSKTLT